MDHYFPNDIESSNYCAEGAYGGRKADAHWGIVHTRVQT